MFEPIKLIPYGASLPTVRFNTPISEFRHRSPSYIREVLSPFIFQLQSSSFQNEAQGVLDIACGSGNEAKVLQGTFNIPVTALDISHNSLINAFPLPNRVQSNAEELPFANNTFKGIHLKDAMVHFFDKSKLFLESLRVLQHRGIMVLTNVTIQNSIHSHITYIENGEEKTYQFRTLQELEKLYTQLSDNASVTQIFPPYFFTTTSSILQEASNAGFSVKSIKYWVPGEDEIDIYEGLVKLPRSVITLQKP
jgi:ubiquinone/menaquinone biosynthesis C-methylase UbiE